MSHYRRRTQCRSVIVAACLQARLRQWVMLLFSSCFTDCIPCRLDYHFTLQVHKSICWSEHSYTMALLLFFSLLMMAYALPLEELRIRSATSCGGDTSLRQCGSGLPSSFCCAQDTTCLRLDGTSTLSVVCCPAGQDCSRIAAITCNVTLQNATLFPASPMHALDLTGALPRCGDACCPYGYECQSNACVVAQSSSATSSQLMATSALATLSTNTATSTASTLSSALQPTISATATAAATASKSTFSGRSFAAGFLPGIILGVALLAVILLWLFRRSQTKANDSSASEKPKRRPHHRQISGPVVHPQYGERTAFVRRPTEQQVATQAEVDDTDRGLATAGSLRKFRVASLFHRSPNPTPSTFQTVPTPKLSSLPLSLRRGSITPPHALRTKQSNHSLRRQMTQKQASPPDDQDQRRRRDDERQERPDLPHQNSQETINIQMTMPRDSPSAYEHYPTPLLRPFFPPAQNRGKDTGTADGSKNGMWLSYRLPPEPTPARLRDGNGLGTPYTPSKYGAKSNADSLRVPGAADGRGFNRDTTFSSLLRQAGIRQSELVGSRK